MLAILLMIDDREKRDKLEELYITYHKELFFVAFQILKDYYDAEDVIQTAFVKIIKHLDKISEIKCKKTRAYLVIIVRNLSYDRYNEKKKIITKDFSEEFGEDAYKDTDISLEQYVLNLEKGKELAAALNKINPSYADILTLRYFYELSNTEIGELINLSSDLVSVRLHRAKAALKKILSKGWDYNET